MSHNRAALVAALFASGVSATTARAQAADTLSGRVIAADSTAISTARVSTTAGGRVFAARTDGAGRYRIIIPAHAGTYFVTAAAFGYSGLTATVQLPQGSFHGTRNFRLNPRRLVLDTLTVRATAARLSPSPLTPGERNAEGTSLTLVAVGADPDRLLDAAALDPGALLVGNGLLSLNGQSPSQNRVSADGAAFGNPTLPSEAVRGVTLLSNTYDPARGQFSGGEIAATTLSGTNRWGGAFSARLDDPRLRYGSVGGDAWGQREREVRLSGGGGGALVRNRLFVYAAADLSRLSGPSAFLDPVDRAGLTRLGLAPDSAARFVAIAQALGLSSTAERSSRSDFASGLARFDYAISTHHSLTLRLDGRHSRLAGLGASPLRLAGADVRERSWDAGAFAQLSSGAGRWSNELRIYGSRGRSRMDDGGLPATVVRVSSTFPDGSGGLAELGFGGPQFSLPDGRHAGWELSDELVLEAGTAHRIKLAGLMAEEGASRGTLPARDGIFVFNSLEDLALGRAASFARGVGAASPTVTRRYGAFSASDTWRVRERVRVIAGLRVEGSPRVRRPELDPGLAPLVGDGGGDIPSDLVVSPRVGFAASLPGRGRIDIRGGAGLFRGASALQSLDAVWAETGTGEFGRRLLCIGPAAPVPDWPTFAADPAAVPVTCAGGSSTFADATPQATVFAPSYAESRVWRGSLGGGGALGRRSWFYLDAMVARGSHLASAVDRNRVAGVVFTLPAENDRPVYASPVAIDPQSGGVTAAASRRDAAFGIVREIGGGAHSRVGRLTGGVGGIILRSTLVSLGFTLTRAEDERSGVPAPAAPAASTGGDASRLEWGPSEWDQRLSLQAIVTHTLGPKVHLGMVGRLASGLPFTPGVAGDVNGDGLFNDRAFVFRPSDVADTTLANGIARLLDRAPGSVRACLARQAGAVAERNSCRGPWSPSLDAHVEIIARGDVESRRLLVTLTASNVTAGLDYLLHGAQGLRGWGQYPLVDGTLLQVRGFDPAAHAFRYQVNPNFGRRPAGLDARNAFALIVSARVAVGADPRYQPLERMAEVVGLGSDQTARQVRARLAQEVRNVPGAILALDETDPAALGLAPAQAAALRRASDELRPRLSGALDALASALMARGPATAARRAAVDDRAAELQALVAEGTGAARRILTPAQWQLLPAWVLKPPRADELERPTREVTVPLSTP